MMHRSQHIFSTGSNSTPAHILRFLPHPPKLKKSIILLFLSGLFISFFILQPARAALQRYTLSGVMTGSGDEFSSPSAKISPDGKYVVYMSDQQTQSDYAPELFVAPIDGSSAPVSVSHPASPISVIWDFAISPDSRRIVYQAHKDTIGDFVHDQLYSVPVTGGTVTKLNEPLPAGGIIYGFFLISPDSRRVIFQGDQETETVVELFSVPVDGGGTVTKLNGPLVAGGNVSAFTDFKYNQDFLISPDSSRVEYRADQVIDEVVKLSAVNNTSNNSSLLRLFLPAILSGIINPTTIPTCKEIAGNWSGTWAEISCDGEQYAGSWTGVVYENCIFYGTDNWDFLQGTIDPITLALTGSGISRDGCGTVDATGDFTRDGTVTGRYTYGFGGGGSFSGALIQN